MSISRNLKILHIYGSSYERFYEAFINCKNLESFTLDYSLHYLSADVLRTILKSNKRLKKLELCGSSLFSQNFSSEIDFKLTEFLFNGLSDNSDYLQNFNQFLITQRDSLERLRVERWINVQVFGTILSMSRLKKLFLDVQNLPPFTNREDFSRSQLITSLELSDFQNKCVMECTVLLQAFPNLKYLQISRMYNELADAISVGCKSLKRLHVERFEVVKIQNIEFFSKLEEFTCSCVVNCSNTLYESIRIAEKKLRT